MPWMEIMAATKHQNNVGWQLSVDEVYALELERRFSSGKGIHEGQVEEQRLSMKRRELHDQGSKIPIYYFNGMTV